LEYDEVLHLKNGLVVSFISGAVWHPSGMLEF